MLFRTHTHTHTFTCSCGSSRSGGGDGSSHTAKLRTNFNLPLDWRRVTMVTKTSGTHSQQKKRMTKNIQAPFCNISGDFSELWEGFALIRDMFIKTNPYINIWNPWKSENLECTKPQKTKYKYLDSFFFFICKSLFLEIINTTDDFLQAMSKQPRRTQF